MKHVLITTLPPYRIYVGATLSVGVMDYRLTHGNAFYLHRNENGEIDTASPGMFVEVMDQLALQAGFSWRENYGVVFQPRWRATTTQCHTPSLLLHTPPLFFGCATCNKATTRWLMWDCGVMVRDHTISLSSAGLPVRLFILLLSPLFFMYI